MRPKWKKHCSLQLYVVVNSILCFKYVQIISKVGELSIHFAERTKKTYQVC